MPWWFRQNETRWNGPYHDREEAIYAGSGAYGIEQFTVMQADQAEYDLSPGGRRLVEMLRGMNADRNGPGRNPPFATLTSEQVDNLGLLVGEAIEAWAHTNSINKNSLYFTTQGEPELIPAIDDATSYSTELASEDVDLPGSVQIVSELSLVPDPGDETHGKAHTLADDGLFFKAPDLSAVSPYSDRFAGVGLIVAIVAGVLFVVPPLLHLTGGWDCVFGYGVCN